MCGAVCMWLCAHCGTSVHATGRCMVTGCEIHGDGMRSWSGVMIHVMTRCEIHDDDVRYRCRDTDMVLGMRVPQCIGSTGNALRYYYGRRRIQGQDIS